MLFSLSISLMYVFTRLVKKLGTKDTKAFKSFSTSLKKATISSVPGTVQVLPYCIQFGANPAEITGKMSLFTSKGMCNAVDLVMEYR